MEDPTVSEARRFEQSATELQGEGRYREAEAPLREAIRLWKLLRDPLDLEVLNDEMSLAVSFRRRGDVELALPMLERVTGVLAQRAFIDREHAYYYRLALNNLASACVDAQQLPKAEAALKLALTMVDLAPDAEALGVERARILDNLAVVSTARGEHGMAAVFAEESLETWLTERGEDDVDTAIAMANLGAAQMRQDQLTGGRPLLCGALTILNAHLGTEHARIAQIFVLIGELELRSGDGAASRDALQMALEIGARVELPNDHPDMARAREWLELADPGATS